MNKMNVEINSRACADNIVLGGAIMITPPINEDFWLMRVPLSPKQAIVAFPKFGVIGIGFQHEDDWNTNLPSQCDAKEIFDHIKHNKGDKTIKNADCVAAIRLLQDKIKEVKR